MRTRTFDMPSTQHLPAQSNTSGSAATRTSNQSKCGGGFVKCGSPGLKSFWIKAYGGSGTIWSILVIGAYPLCPNRFKNLGCGNVGLCFVGWPSLGYKGRPILMSITTIRHAEGQTVGRYCPQVSRTSYLKTQKRLTRSISRLVKFLVKRLY